MMKRFSFFSSVAGLGVFVACGGSTTNLGSDSQDTTSNDGGGASSSSSSSGASSSSSSSSSGSTSGGSSGSSGQTGIACGWHHVEDLGERYQACPEGSYCKHPTGQCNATGTCVTKTVGPPPPGCAALLPVCGCDGNDYCSADEAQWNGTTVADFSGGCKFDCGSAGQCNGLTEYCEHGSGGAVLPDGGTNQFWGCKPLPKACDGANRTCDCLKNAQVSYGACSVENGHVKVEQFYP